MTPFYWIGDVRSTSSYAHSAHRILPLLMAKGWPVRPIVNPLPPGTVPLPDPAWQQWVDCYQIPAGSSLTVPGTAIYHALPPTILPTSSPGWIYTGWDARPYPFGWVDTLKRHHGLITWSKWSADIAQASGITNIHIIPLGWDPGAPPPTTILPKDPATIHIGTLGQGVPRKRMVDTLIGLWQTFTNQDSVELWIKIAPSQQLPAARLLAELHHHAHHFPERPPTHLWVGEWTAHQLAAWYQRLDIFTSLSAGEGFGLPMLEAAAWGSTVVVPQDAGGWEDWLPPEIPRIPTTWVPIVPGGIPDWQETGMEWTVPDIPAWQARLWDLVHHRDTLRHEQAVVAPAAYQYGHPEQIYAAWEAWAQTVLSV